MGTESGDPQGLKSNPSDPCRKCEQNKQNNFHEIAFIRSVHDGFLCNYMAMTTLVSKTNSYCPCQWIN